MRVAALLLALHWTNRPMRGVVGSKKSVIPVLLSDDWTNRSIYFRLSALPLPRRHFLDASSEVPRRLLKRLVYGDARHRSCAVPIAAEKAI